MRKQGHTHKPGHCITNDNQLEWRASSKLTLDDRLRMDRQGVFVCCKGYACVCMKMEEGLERCALREKKQTKKTTHANPVPCSNFQLRQQIKYNKGINSIVNQFPAPSSVSWISLSLLSFYDRGEKKKKKRVCLCVMCVFVWMHIRIADKLQDEGTSSLGPGCRGRERMRRMEGRQRRCVFTEWHSSYSPRSSLCSSDLGTHTHTHTHNIIIIIIIIIITVMTNTDPPVRQTAVRTACIQGLFFCLHSQLHCELLSYMSG